MCPNLNLITVSPQTLFQLQYFNSISLMHFAGYPQFDDCKSTQKRLQNTYCPYFTVHVCLVNSALHISFEGRFSVPLLQIFHVALLVRPLIPCEVTGLKTL